MPKCKNYMINIPRFYKWQTFDHLMFGYVEGLMKALPAMSVTDAILLFLKEYDLSEDEYCFENARGTYYRISKSLRDLEKEQRKV